MKILITGIEGFVGKHLSDYLLTKGYEIIGTYYVEGNINILDKRINLIKLDITDMNCVISVMQDIQPDIVYHLAAQSSAYYSWKNPQLTMSVNVNGALNILESVKQLSIKTRIILIGSSEEYGYVKPEDMPVNEQQAIVPGNPYAISKIGQSMFGKLYANSYNLDVIIVRAFNHFGPGQSEKFVIADFAKRIAEMESGLIEPIMLVGNLQAKRDFTDVRDIVRAYYLIGLKGKSKETYNIGSGECYEISDILNRLIKMSHLTIVIKNDPNRLRPSDVPIIQCDNSKLIAATEWTQECDFNESLLAVLDYWRKMY